MAQEFLLALTSMNSFMQDILSTGLLLIPLEDTMLAHMKLP